MTEKKKLKKRVRARMEETGECYTEALSNTVEAPADSELEEDIRAFLDARTPSAVRGRARSFHGQYCGDSSGSERLADHILEIVMPRRISWATREESYQPEARGPNAADELKELLLQYRAGSLGVKENAPQRFPIKAPLRSGWLGDRSKEDCVASYQDLPSNFDEEFQFDLEGSAPRSVLLDPDEEAFLHSFWKWEPQLNWYRYGGAAPPRFVPGFGKPETQNPDSSNEGIDTAHLTGTVKALGREIERLRSMLKKAGFDPDA